MEKWQLVKTCTLIAWVFTLIYAAGWGIYLVFFVIVGGISSAIFSPFGGGVSAFMFLAWVPSMVFSLVFLILTGLVSARVKRMNQAANKGDVDTLRTMNSTGWAVVALLGAGIIPGVALLVAQPAIEELSKQSSIKEQ